MKFSVGYQLTADGEWPKYIIEQRESVKEVYFAWNGFASGRDEAALPDGMTAFEAEARKREELKELSGAGIGMNLLLNGACYGAHTLARSFYNSLGDALDEVCEKFGVSSVTTTSPLIARFVKQNFPDLSVRASVNMEIGSVDGMKYLAQWFDGYYLQREYNRDLAHIGRLKAWCGANGKKLFLLANSGCLNHCSAHQFHDNLVAHRPETDKMDNAYQFQGICWDYFKNRQNLDTYLSETNFIRPEDLHLYEDYFDCVKLATRANAHPVRVLRSYIERRYTGSVMDLLEPDHSGAVYPLLVENSAIGPEFMERVTKCDRICETCGFCRDVLRKATVFLEEQENADE